MKKISPSPAGIPQEILCSADLSNRPPGLSAMEFLTAQYEQSRGIESDLTRRLKAAQKAMTPTGPTASATTRPTPLYEFIRTGQVSASTSARDMRVMLDLARDLILSYGEQARAAATPAPAPAPATITAAEFAGPPPPKMLRSEFDKMTDANRSKFIRDGGKLIADPKPAR